ncbi:MAG: hypothetical protein C4K58_08145 [Flavobacteriaceae bacterium]|nr:MAG: hypothetical protein C4K58_08145 [Flavobacteriaceae bacterium]
MKINASIRNVAVLVVCLFTAKMQGQIEGDRVRIRRAQKEVKPEITKKIEVPKLEVVDVPKVENLKEKIEEVNIEYEIQDVLVESDFDLSKIEAERVSVGLAPSPDKWNYLTMGYGYNTLYNGELYLSGRVDKLENFGIKYSNHSSFQNVNEDRYNWDSRFFQNNIEIFADANLKNAALQTKIGGDFDKYNYYGLGDTSIKEINNGVSFRRDQLFASAQYDNLKNKFVDKAGVNFNRLADDFKSVEYLASAVVSGNYKLLDAKEGVNLSALASLGGDFVDTNFDEKVHIINSLRQTRICFHN